MNKEPDTHCNMGVAGNPAGCDKLCSVLETPPAKASSCPEMNHLCDQKQEIPSAPPPTIDEKDSTALMIDSPSHQSIDLSTCSVVVYEERNRVPGVKFVAEDGERWTLVMKGEVKRSTVGIGTQVMKGKDKETDMEEGDGSILKPRKSNAEKLQLYRAKEIKYAKMNGTPGLTFRTGKTKHSYEWIPITSGSPIATRTRTKLKS